MVHAEKATENTTVTTNNAEVEDLKRTRSGSFSMPKAKVLRPFNTSEVKILLLENVNETAVSAFAKQGYQVRSLPNKQMHIINM